MPMTMAQYKGGLAARWPTLALSSLMMVGSYFCYDNPSALNAQMKDYFTKVVPEADRLAPEHYSILFNLLYTVYSIPNVVLPFFGGYFVDKLTARLMNIVFCGCILVGQITLTIGCFLGSFPLMILGRVFFGFGGESLCVGQSALIQEWFAESLNVVSKGSCIARFGLGLAFAMGLNLSLARLGSVFNNIASPAIAQFMAERLHKDGDGSGSSSTSDGLGAVTTFANYTNDGTYGTALQDSATSAGAGVPYALLFGVLVCCFSMLSAVITYCIDKSTETAAYRAGVRNPRAKDGEPGSESLLGADEPSEEMVGISSVLKFGLAFWLLSVSCVSVYACVLPWNNIAQDFLLEKYLCPGGCQDVVPANPTTTAAEGTVKYAMSIPYVISGAASPFLGGLVDKCGHRVILTTLSAAALVAVHLGFAFAPTGMKAPAFMYVPLIGQGIAYSIYASALWPSVQATVAQHEVGTAYGVVTAIQNGGLALFPVIVGVLKSHFHHYAPFVELFFASLAGVGVLSGVMLFVVDRSQLGGRLERAGDGVAPDDDSLAVN